MHVGRTPLSSNQPRLQLAELYWGFQTIKAFIRKQTADFFRLCQEDSLNALAAADARHVPAAMSSGSLAMDFGAGGYSTRSRMLLLAENARANDAHARMGAYVPLSRADDLGEVTMPPPPSTAIAGGFAAAAAAGVGAGAMRKDGTVTTLGIVRAGLQQLLASSGAASDGGTLSSAPASAGAPPPSANALSEAGGGAPPGRVPSGLVEPTSGVSSASRRRGKKGQAWGDS